MLPDIPSVYGLPEDPKVPTTAVVQKDLIRPLSWITWGAVTAGLALNVIIARSIGLRKREEE